jgi:dTDP-4-amino-4,6-dideoxygalactose transaminase
MEIAAAVDEILTSGALTLGPYTRRFEAAFATAHAARHAAATSSGTAALDIALRGIGVTDRDVVVPANTFYATAAAVMQAGGKPVFADVDAATFALSPATLEAALTPDTAAVVLVHIGGLITPQAEDLARICQERGVALVEDAAHAHGSSLGGRFAGSFGVAAGFSLYATKVVTSGEGGMLVTSSDLLADEARIYRDQGKGAFSANHHVRFGYAWRMSEQNAVTGLVHLRRMEEFIERRREVAARYDEVLASLDGLQPLTEPAGCRSKHLQVHRVAPGRRGPRVVQAGGGPGLRRSFVRGGLRHPAAPSAGVLRMRGSPAARGGGPRRQAHMPAGAL